MSSAVRNALRNLYRRESYYLRRYFAQSEDAVDFTTVVRHMRHLVSNALVLDTSASQDRASSPGSGDTNSQPSQCGSNRPDHAASDVCSDHRCSIDSSRLVVGASTTQPGSGASTSLGVAGCAHPHADDCASIRHRASVDASCVQDISRRCQEVRGVGHSACASMDGGEITPAALVADPSNSAQTVTTPSMHDRARQGTSTVDGTTKSSKLHPKAHMRRILQARALSHAVHLQLFCMATLY